MSVSCILLQSIVLLVSADVHNSVYTIFTASCLYDIKCFFAAAVHDQSP